MSGPRPHPIDFVRKALIVVALIGAILLLHQFAVPSDDFDPRGLLALGFVVLAAHAIGDLGKALGLPEITGYLLAGLLFGPSIATTLTRTVPLVEVLPPLDEGILSQRVLGQLGLVNALALALIALTAGGELKLDELRRTFRQVLGTVLGMVAAVVALVTAYVVLVHLVLPGSIPALDGLPVAPMIALAVVLAVLAAATSPAASIAIITSTGSRGPVSSTVLTGVVLGEVTVVLLFSAASSVALGAIGGSGSVSVLDSLEEMGASVGIGLVVGVLLGLYLRYVASEILLFLVGTIFLTTYVLQFIHGEPAIAFIAAGLVVSNFSGRGETLIHEVERLSRPVYVVFFALAGAQLDLHVLSELWVPALGLALVRVAGVYYGSRAGARLVGAPQPVQDFAWTGFVSQAGLAIALAGQARAVLPPHVGTPLYSMSMSVLALCQLVGPLVLQVGLQRAGEIGAVRQVATGEPGPLPIRAGAPKRWEPGVPDDPWGPRLPTGSESLDRAIAALEIELQALIHEHAGAPLAQLRRDAEHWLRQLRREALRNLRRAATRTGDGASVAAELRSDAADLALVWRDLVRARTAEPWSPLGLVDALDAHVARLPPAIEAGVVPAVLAPRDEPVLRRIRRALARARNRLVPIKRSVDLHGLGRYHLSGKVPARLEELAALVVRAELHLSDRIAGLLRDRVQELDQIAQRVEDGADPARIVADLHALREHVDREFEATSDELAAIAFDATACATRLVGTAFAELQHDATVVWTLDLPPGRRRFGRVFEERSRGIAALTEGSSAARGLVRGRQELLALELELVAVEARIHSTVRRRAAALARQVRSRGPAQLAQVATLLGSELQAVDDLLAAPPPAGVVSRHLRKDLEPLLHRIREARTTVGGLVADLSGEQWVAGLVEALDAQTLDLSESYAVAPPPAEIGSTLPRAAPAQTIAFRELVSAFVESRVALGLVDVTTELLDQVRQMAAALEEVERVAVFNVELSCAELEVLDEGAPVSPETVDLVRAMVHGAIGRSHHRLVRQLEVAELTADQTGARVQDGVLAQLATLRELLLEGRATEIRATWGRDARLGALARRAEAWRGWVPALRSRADELSRRMLGPERLEAVRVTLGLPGPAEQADASFPPPTPAVELPPVYRRLFSELPMESGDQLAGREAELERIRRALLATGPLRTAAIAGVDPASSAALASAAIRGSFDGVVRIEPRSRADRVLVDGWLARIAGVENHVVVVDELHWLFERRPGGFSPLERLVEEMVADRGRNAWLVVADRAVWDYASVATPLGEAVAARVDLGPLSIGELTRAVMSRHGMSGYGLEFAREDDLGWLWQSLLVSGGDREGGRRDAWFRTLHSASAGVLGDALQLWMASIRSVDDAEERVRIGAVPRPPLARLAQLPDDVLATLLETRRQGWTDEDQHQQLFRTTAAVARAHLAALTQAGLLAPDGDVLRIAPHLRVPLERVFAWRRWR